MGLCEICLNILPSQVIIKLSCSHKHIFCYDCVKQINLCPYCRININTTIHILKNIQMNITIKRMKLRLLDKMIQFVLKMNGY